VREKDLEQLRGKNKRFSLEKAEQKRGREGGPISSNFPGTDFNPI
jgi:hypothetical protein